MVQASSSKAPGSRTNTFSSAWGPGPRALCCWVIFVLVVLLAGRARAERGELAHGLIQLDLDGTRESGFVPWGRPLADGAIETLFIAPGYTMLDVVALNRHLELRAVLAPLVGRTRFDVIDGGMAADATSPLAPYFDTASDAIVMANVDFSLLSDTDQHALIERVEKGVGLVLVTYDERVPKKLSDWMGALTVTENANSVVRGLGFDNVVSALSDVSLYTGDTARVVVIAYRGSAPESHCLIPLTHEDPELESYRYDAFLALIARSLLWVADREPTLRITGIVDVGPRGPDLQEIPPQLLDRDIQRMRDAVLLPPLQPFVFQFNRETTEKYSFRSRVRYPERDMVRTLVFEEEIPKGLQWYRGSIPVGSGYALLDFWLMSRSGVVDWYTQPITLTRWPEVADVRFSKSDVQVNDTVSVSAFIRKDFYRPRRANVLVRARDSFDRVVAERRTSVPREGGRISLELSLVDLIAPSLKVELFATDTGGQQLARWDEERAGYASTRLTVTNLPVPSSFKWRCEVPESDELNVRRYKQRLIDAGVDVSWESQHAVEESAGRIMQFDPETYFADSILSYSRWAPWHAALNGYDGIAMGPAFGTASQTVPFPALQSDGSEAQWFSELAESIAALRGGFDSVFQAAIQDDFLRVSETLFVQKRTPEVSDFNGEQLAFIYSKARVLAFLAAPDPGNKTQRVSLKFKKSFHVYDMLGGESVSRNGKITLDLSPGEVGLLSILPYPVTRLDVQAPTHIYAGRRLSISVDVKTRDALPGDHVVQLSFGPSGRAPLKYYSRNLLCDAGHGTTYIPLAINEVPGLYRLHVRDTLTGVETEKTIQVLPPLPAAIVGTSGV